MAEDGGIVMYVFSFDVESTGLRGKLEGHIGILRTAVGELKAKELLGE